MLSGTIVERVFRKTISVPLVGPLRRMGIQPDHLTLCGLALALLAGSLVPWSPPAAGIVLLVSGLLDSLDGTLARATHHSTRPGALLDSTLDRYGEFAVLLGIWVYLAREGHAFWGGIWTLSALQGSVMVSYARARAEGLGYALRGGLFQRAERLVLVALGLLASPWGPKVGLDSHRLLLVTMGLLAVGTNLTALRRIVRARAELKRVAESIQGPGG